MKHDKFPVLSYDSAEVDITAAGAKNTFNLGNLFNQLPGEYEKVGIRAYAMGAVVQLRIGVTSQINPTTVVQLCSDRLPSFNVIVNTPTLTDNHTRQEMNALHLNLINQINNAKFKLFCDKVPNLRGVWAPYTGVIEDYNTRTGIDLNTNRQFDELDRTQSWHLDNSPLQLTEPVGGIVQEVVDPIFIPFCYDSGENRYGGTIQKDVLPLSMVVNNDTPWLITLTHNLNQSIQAAMNLLNPALGATVSVFAKVSLIVTHRPKDSYRGFGVPITNAAVPLNNAGTLKPTNEAYRFLGVMPDANLPLAGVGSVTDGYGLYYRPDNIAYNPDTTIFRQLIGNNQVFPLTFSSFYGHFINAFNAGADMRSNPRLFIEYETTPNTVFKGTNSTIAGVPVLNIFANARGFKTHFPVIPLINNCPALDGFVSNMLAMDKSESLSIDYSPGLTSAQGNRAFGSILSTNRDQDVANIAQWEEYGCLSKGDCKKPAGNYVACVNNPTSYNVARYKAYLPVRADKR